MRLLLYVLFLISLLTGGLNTISRINEYAKEAALAYRHHDYASAIAAYEYLLEKLEVQDDQLRLNLAHAYFKANQLEQAQASYRLLADHPSSHLRAVAQLQLGNIATMQGKYKPALALYKAALTAEPENDLARYNFELLKKYLELHPEKEQEQEDKLPPPNQDRKDSTQAPQEKNQEPQPQQKPDENGAQEQEVDAPQPSPAAQSPQQGNGGQDKPEQQAADGEREAEEASGSQTGDTKGQNPESDAADGIAPKGTAENITDQDQRAQTQRARLRQVNMTPEKAKLLLDAMRNAELQYIQQLPKKATKKADPNKPDW